MRTRPVGRRPAAACLPRVAPRERCASRPWSGLAPAHRLVAARARGGDDQDAGWSVALVLDLAADGGADADEAALRRRCVDAVDDGNRVAVEDDEDLLVVALLLGVLGD